MGISYTGVILDKVSQNWLCMLFNHFFLDHLMPIGFRRETVQGNPLAHHMTINLGQCRDRSLLGTEVKLVLDAWAIDERAMAVRVKDPVVHCDNETPHITLYVNPDKGGSPKHSNDLTNWIPLIFEAQVSGIVKEM
jgi:hypothetical protein